MGGYYEQRVTNRGRFARCLKGIDSLPARRREDNAAKLRPKRALGAIYAQLVGESRFYPAERERKRTHQVNVRRAAVTKIWDRGARAPPLQIGLLTGGCTGGGGCIFLLIQVLAKLDNTLAIIPAVSYQSLVQR